VECKNTRESSNKGATGTISESLRKYMGNLPEKHKIKALQKTAILGTAHISWKVLIKRRKHSPREIAVRVL
jgi:hypothetical protein